MCWQINNQNLKNQQKSLTRKQPQDQLIEVFDFFFQLFNKQLLHMISLFYYNRQIIKFNIMIEEENNCKRQEIIVVPVSEWPCRPLHQRYTLHRQLGQGTFGSVYEGNRIDDNKKFALKKMQNFEQKQDKEGKQYGFPITTLRQIKLLQKMEHKNILNIVDVVYERLHRSAHRSPIIYLCLDLMDTDLGYLVQDKQYKFTPYRIQQITKQILNGLQYLHGRGVAHRDLKPANILINSEDIVKVADFGLAKKLGKFSTTLVVTMWYRAPQLFYGLKTYTPNIDIWSLGCILAEFMIGKPLFGHCQSQKQELNFIYELVGTPDTCDWQQVKDLQKYNLYKPQESKESSIIYYLKKTAPEYQHENLLLDLLEKMLRLNPDSRYSAKQCLNHDFFAAQYEQEALLPEYIVEKKHKLEKGQQYVHKKPKF